MKPFFEKRREEYGIFVNPTAFQSVPGINRHFEILH